MALRIRKSFKVAPGVRMTVGKKSGSISVGGKGFRVTKSTTGRTTTSAGIPGTGVGWTSSSSSSSTQKRPAPPPAHRPQPEPPQPRAKRRLFPWVAAAAVIILLIIIL